MRLAWPILILVLTASTAVAAEDLTEDVPEKDLVDSVVDTIVPVAKKGGDVAVSAASATASGASSAASGLGVVLKAIGRGAVAAADVVADGLVAGGKLLVKGVVAAAKGIAHIAVATVHLLIDAALLVATGLKVGAEFVVTVASLAWTAIASVGSALWSVLAAAGGLLAKGGRFVADHPRESLYVAGGAGAAAGAYGLWAWLRRLGVLAPLAGFYTRIAKSDILDNEVRARIFEHVKDAPGVHPSALKEGLGLGWGTIVYHLDRLEETGLVIARKAGGQKCYFVNGGALDPRAQRAAAALKHPKARDIAGYVSVHPDATQKEVGEALGISSALVSWHVKRLVKAGVIDQQRTSRGSLLRLTPETEPALAAA